MTLKVSLSHEREREQLVHRKDLLRVSRGSNHSLSYQGMGNGSAWKVGLKWIKSGQMWADQTAVAHKGKKVGMLM